MKRRTRVDGQLWWLSIPKASSRDEIAAIQKRITRLQAQQGMYCYSAWVFETRSELHAHIVFVGNAWIAERLQRSAICKDCKVAAVTDPEGLARKYLVKERTPQASYGRADLGGRIRGSHRIEGGGDRVRLSRELERDAIEAGLVESWRHTNAKRSSVRKAYRPRPITKRAAKPAGQILLFPEMDKPVSRLRCFGGGMMPPAVAVEIEFLRKQRRLSQCQLAKLIGRSQGQYANAIRGHDPMSATSVNRLRDVLLADTSQSFILGSVSMQVEACQRN